MLSLPGRLGGRKDIGLGSEWHFHSDLLAGKKNPKLEKLSDECRNRSEIVAKVVGFTQNDIIPSLLYHMLTCWIKGQSHCLVSLQTAAFINFFISRHSSAPGSGAIFRAQVLTCLKIFCFLFVSSLLAWFQFVSLY